MSDTDPYQPVLIVRPGRPFALRMRVLLRLHHVPHTVVGFRDDEAGAARVRAANAGNEVSPTVQVGQGWFVNPSWRDVADACSGARR